MDETALTVANVASAVAGTAQPDVVPAIDGFAAFYAAEWPPMVRLATGLTGSPERAAELVQDAFERTLLRWGRLDRPGGYLRTAVVNGCRSDLRRRAVRQRFPLAGATPMTTDADEPDGDLARALARLSPRRRIAVVLRFWADLPEAEIADLMGVRQATARSVVHFEGLADTAYPGYRLSVTSGVPLPGIAALGRLYPDGVIDLTDVDLDLSPWPDDD